MKYLVTGASGFVGKHLCSELLYRGYTVRAAVRTETMLGSELEQVIIRSIDGGTDWADALCDVDVVIHLAARAHILNETAEVPLAEFMKVNQHGTEQLALQAAQIGVKRLVYVSTIGVNGGHTTGGKLFSEQSLPDPHSPYAISKWQAELVLQRVSAKTGLEITVVRPPLVYGAAAPGNVAKMLSVLGERVPLPLASIHNMRSLIYVKNLADALIVCATHPAAAGETYLISDGEDISTPDLLRQLGGAMGRPARLFSFPPKLLVQLSAMVGKLEQAQRLTDSLQIDSGKIRRELNWTPPYSLQQGLQATAEGYRDKHL